MSLATIISVLAVVGCMRTSSSSTFSLHSSKVTKPFLESLVHLRTPRLSLFLYHTSAALLGNCKMRIPRKSRSNHDPGEGNIHQASKPLEDRQQRTLSADIFKQRSELERVSNGRMPMSYIGSDSGIFWEFHPRCSTFGSPITSTIGSCLIGRKSRPF